MTKKNRQKQNKEMYLEKVIELDKKYRRFRYKKRPDSPDAQEPYDQLLNESEAEVIQAQERLWERRSKEGL